MTHAHAALPTNMDDCFHDHLNSINPSIQFTMENESDGQLPFLDILLSREEGSSISTSVHRNATHTDHEEQQCEESFMLEQACER